MSKEQKTHYQQVLQIFQALVHNMEQGKNVLTRKVGETGSSSTMVRSSHYKSANQSHQSIFNILQ